MPLLEYRALLLEAPVEEVAAPGPVAATRAGAVTPPAPLPVTYRLTAGAHLYVDAGGSVSLRRAPDIYELVMENII